MKSETAEEFAKKLDNNPQFEWWGFHIEQLEASGCYKVVGRNRVTGRTVNLYHDDESEAVVQTTANLEPNDAVRVCTWLAQEIHKQTGNNSGAIEYLTNRVAALEEKAGIEPDEDSPF